MTYRLQAYSSVEADLAAIRQPDQAKVREAIRSLADQPRPPGVSKLAGYADVYRIRIGNYRVAYKIRDHELIVLVVAAAERGSIYRLLKRRLR